MGRGGFCFLLAGIVAAMAAVAESPVRLTLKNADGKPLELVPYGCAKLHISAFPTAD